MATPKQNVAYVYVMFLIDTATGDFLVDPPIEAGDFTVSVNLGATYANLTNLPAVANAQSDAVIVSFEAAEIVSKVILKVEDVTGDAWRSQRVFLDIDVYNIDDVASKVNELYKTDGLDSSDPMTNETDKRSTASGDIIIDVTGDGVTTSTQTRRP